MNKTLKNIYTICLIASLAASFAYLRDAQKPTSKPFIFVSHFSKKAPKHYVEAVSAVAKVEKRVVKKKQVAKKINNKIVKKKISFAKPLNKEVKIQAVSISKPALDVKEIELKRLATTDANVVNNKELIEHYGYDVNLNTLKTISWANYFDSKNVARNLASLNEGEGPTLEKQKRVEENRLAEIKKEEIKRTNENLEDFVNTVAAQKVDTVNVNTQEETDLVFYDYSKSETEQEQNVELANQIEIKESQPAKAKVEVTVVNKENPETKQEQPTVVAAQEETPNIISQNVLAAIEREMGGSPRVAAAPKVNTQPRAQNEYSKVIDQISKKRSAAKKVNTQKSGYSKTIITTYEVNLGESSNDALRSFQVASASEGNNRIDDNNNGYINIEAELASSQGVYRGTILKRGYLRTSMDIALEPGTIEVAIPSITQESMMKFLEAQGINGLGGFLLIDKDRGIQSLDIDSEFEAKFDLDENFKLTNDDSAVRYILFAGVNAGNTLLKVRTVDNEYSEKIIHIVEDELLFEALLMKTSEKIEVITLERTILSNRASELDIDASKIKYFNRDIVATKKASNLHEIKVPILPLGMRKYLEFSHLEDTIYVGIGDNAEVELPSSDFIVNLLEANNMSGMEGRCVIQINMNKPLLKVESIGESSRGPMSLDKFYLEKNGSLSEEETPLSTKIFILGDQQGIINVKVEYQDNTVDYLQTFCSPETYLLEQL